MCSWCPTTLYKYKYRMHAHIHGPPYDRCPAQTVPCTRRRIVCTSKHTASRTLNVSLRLPMPNTVHVHVRCARSTPLTCNRCTAQTAHNRCTAYFRATSTRLGPYMLKAVYARINVLATIGTPLGLHMTTTVHGRIHAHTYKRAPLGLPPYEHRRKMRLTSSSKISDRTLRSGKQYAAAQHCTSSTWSYLGPVRVL